MSDWHYPAMVAHRGGGYLAPENTLAAIKVGAAQGYRMFECDAKLSADGEIFLLHDDTLERTSDGWGMAGEQPWSALALLDAGRWFSADFAGEPLPRLRDVAALCRELNLQINIEIKPTPGCELETGAAVARAALRWWEGMDTPLLSSFSVEALEAARDVAPDLPRGLLLHAWRDDALMLARDLGCRALHLNHELLDQARTESIRGAGLCLLVYTVNQPERARQLLGWGVNSICSDAIDLMGPDFR